MKKYTFFIVLAVLLFSGCRAKKETVSITKVTDTLILKTEVIRRPPLLTTLTINEVCDTITGKAKEFRQTVVVGTDTLDLWMRNNELTVKNKKLEEITKNMESYKSNTSSITEIKKEKVYVWSTATWWFLVWAIMSTLLHFIDFKGLVKRFVGWF